MQGKLCKRTLNEVLLRAHGAASFPCGRLARWHSPISQSACRVEMRCTTAWNCALLVGGMLARLIHHAFAPHNTPGRPAIFTRPYSFLAGAKSRIMDNNSHVCAL